MESWAKLQEQTRKGEYVQEEDGIQVLILSHLSEEFLWDLALSLEQWSQDVRIAQCPESHPLVT